MLIVVCAALIRGDGAILVQQRPAGKQFAHHWEFPGGKVEPGETLARALVRELAEELDIVVDEGDLVPTGFGTDAGAAGPMLLLLYRCRRWSGEPRLIEAAALDWRDPQALRTLLMPPADRPLVDILVTLAAATQAA